jgi:hypothetical protein
MNDFYRFEIVLTRIATLTMLGALAFGALAM